MTLVTEPQRLTYTTIKVRRLCYIIQLTKILQSHGPLPPRVLFEKIEEWSVNNKNKLLEYESKIPFRKKKLAGYIIPTSNHEPAKRYIKMALEMGLIIQLGNKFRNTKFGIVLSIFNENENPFDLTLEQICFLLNTILYKDHDYLKCLIRVLDEKSDTAYQKFRDLFSHRMEKKIRFASMNLPLYEAMKSVAKWEKNPKRFFEESIKVPRYEWLWDLKILDYHSGRYEIKENFLPFFSEEIENYKWYLSDYYEIFYKSYQKFLGKCLYWENLQFEDKKKILITLLESAYKNFGLKEYWKISASQFFEYSSIILLCTKNTVSTYDDLEKTLIEVINLKEIPYWYKKMVSRDDIGYIIKSNSYS